jgi:hypothetical protein
LRLYLGTQVERSLNAISVTTSLAWMSYDDMNFCPIHKMSEVFILYLGTNKIYGSYS